MRDANNGELPHGWAYVTAEQIGRFYRGVTYKKHEASGTRKPGTHAVLRANNIDGQIRLDELVFVPESRIKPEQFVKRGDIVIAMSSGSKRLVGKTAQARESIDAAFGAFCGLYRPFEDVSAKYIGYFFQSPTYDAVVQAASSGVNINNLRREHIEELTLPLAPLPEQRRIVDKIEELFSDLDAGEAALEKTERLLERYRQSILKAAVEGELTREWREQNPDFEPADVLLDRILEERRARWEADQLAKYEAKGKKPPAGWKNRYKPPTEPDTADLPELPEGWWWASVDQVSVDKEIGLVRSRALQHRGPEGFRYIKMDSVTVDGRVDLTDVAYVDADDSEVLRYGLREGDLLFNTRNSFELVGKVGYVSANGRGALYNNNLMRIRTGSYFSSAFLCYQMCSHPFRARLERVKRATTNIAAVYGKDLLPLPIALPQFAEQEAIVEEVERHLSVVDVVAEEVTRQRGRAKQLRRAILQHAFEGRLVPQDPEDEPAEVLLERIQAEKNGKAPAGQNWGRKGGWKAKEGVEEVRVRL